MVSLVGNIKDLAERAMLGVFLVTGSLCAFSAWKDKDTSAREKQTIYLGGVPQVTHSHYRYLFSGESVQP